MRYHEFNEENGHYIARSRGLQDIIDRAYSGKVNDAVNDDQYNNIIDRVKRGDSSICDLNGYNQDTMLQAVSSPPKFTGDIHAAAVNVEAAVQSPARPRRRRRKGCLSGATLSPQAFVQRRASGWTKVERTRPVRPVLRIGVNISAIHNQTQEELYHRGAAAVAITHALQNMGYAVELTAYGCVTCLKYRAQDTYFINEIPVKPANRPLDINIAALVCAECAFNRCVVLPYYDTISRFNVRPGHGAPKPAPADYAAKYDIIIDRTLETQEDTVAYVKEILNGAEVKI